MSDEITKLQEQVKTLFANDERHEKELDELKDDVKDCNRVLLDKLEEMNRQMATRLPTWATILISVLTALLGGLVGRGGL